MIINFFDRHPKQDELAEKNGMSRSTVQRALKELEELGFISVTDRLGRGLPNTYKLNH
ncbi:helix-turn-helix domain-containing protein [Micromonospora sp. CA-248260]|uniref:helix-turn-helix domain-containing protein n=1 Tax=Micromonospora sp. CA-248260 TaxID=3239962 RepID=UPI003D944752